MKILKKYPNRRIYDSDTSQFVTLVDVRKMVLNHEPLKVLHSKTGEDLTRNVLLQIITEQESEGHAPLLTNRALEELIRFYGNQMAPWVSYFIEQQILHFLKEQDRLLQQFNQAVSGQLPTPEQLAQHLKATGYSPPPWEKKPDT